MITIYQIYTTKIFYDKISITDLMQFFVIFSC